MQLAKGKSMIFGYFLTRAQISLLDCCITLFRVHLYSNHVISMVIFHTGTDTWSPIDINNCNGCLIYFINNLVSGMLSQYQVERILKKACRKFCLRHPEVRDVCDISKILFFDSNIVWYIAAAMFLLNNTFIQVYY